MTAVQQNENRSRFLSRVLQTIPALLIAACILYFAPPVAAQTYSLQGPWSGSRVETPADPPLPENSNQALLLYQVGTGSSVVGTLTTYWPGTPYYWDASVTGTISGSSLNMTWTIVPGSVNLPAGTSACGETETLTLAMSSGVTTATMPSYNPCAGSSTVASYAFTLNGWQKPLGDQCSTQGSTTCNGLLTLGSSGPSDAGSSVGDPIESGTGNAYESVTDYTTAGPNRLAFARYYNSLAPNLTYAVSLGHNWRTQYDRYLQLISSSQVVAERANGQQLTFNLVSSVWTPDSDVDMTLTNSGSTWTLTDHSDNIETYTGSSTKALLKSVKARNGYTQTLAYNGSNQLTSVTDSYSRKLGFTYTSGLLTQVTTPDSLVLTYGYNTAGTLLTSVSYNTSPATSQSYAYTNSSFPYALTSITDEDANTYKSWTYDSYGRGLTSQLGTGSNPNITTVTYNDSAGTRTVTNALGQQVTYTLAMLQNSSKVMQLQRLASSTVPAATESFVYDSNGYLAQTTDWGSVITAFTNDAHGDPTTVVEDSGGSSQRTTTIVYDPTWVHLPDSITTTQLTTSYTYDSHGNPLTKKLADTGTQTVPYSTNGQTRTWHYTWNNFLPKTVKTPDSNTTTFTFDSTGALTNTQNALLQNTQITSHTGGGLPLTVIDPNSVTTTLTYSPRNWLLTTTVDPSGSDFITTNTYDAAGNLAKVMQPDGSYLANSFDTAHRLTKVADSFGNSMDYTLDALGDRTVSNIENPSATVTRGHTATYDSLGRKLTDVGGMSQTTTYTWGSRSNLASIKDPLSNLTSQTFDDLNRLSTHTDPSPGGETQYTYNVHNKMLSLESPNGATTNFVYDGFGEAIQEASPDRGTWVYHYDTDGNLTQRVDGASHTMNATYDALDRPLTNSYPSDSTENVGYTYDQTGTGFAYGIGRLTSLTDAAGSLTRTYDERGNLITDKRVSGTSTLLTTYGYDAASRILTVTYPDSALLTYTRDAMGRITAASLTPSGGSAASVVSSVTYEPFGPTTGFTYGNGVTDVRAWDLDYRMTSVADTGTSTIPLSFSYLYDKNNDPLTITDHVTSGNTQTLTYDGMLHVSTGSGFYGSLGWSYGSNGNGSQTGSLPITMNYVPDSNQLSNFVIGSTTTTVSYTGGNISAFSPAYLGATSLTYNQANRLASAANGGTTLGSYVYDAFGNRLKKTAGSATTLYQYDPEPLLLAEVAGSAETDYIYLNDCPVTTFNASAGTLSYLHTDRLCTPQRATSSAQASVWNTAYQPFGTTGTITGTITQNLRFPGQYYDAETGFYHNGLRDYAPTLGRYLQSDPIGVVAGFNTFQYVGGNPMSRTDKTGEDDNGLTDTPQQTPIPGNGGTQMCGGEQNKDACIDKCTELLPTGSLSGAPFFRCMEECMGRNSY